MIILRTIIGNLVANKIKTLIMFVRARLPISLNFQGHSVFIKIDCTPMGHFLQIQQPWIFKVIFTLYQWIESIFPKFICWSPNPQCDGIWRWGLWKGNYNLTRSWLWGSCDGINDINKKRKRDQTFPSLTLSPPCEHREKMVICKPGSGSSPWTESASTLILGYPASKIE